ncbi:hypothetical protein ABZZ20_31935 [Streptomyces sp. NPDC006430]|uniref:hypothetical protein n=1 Tax=Streptomyces sp. NPDC006430 TaxID=3154299 RepID=UPI0033AB3CC1
MNNRPTAFEERLKAELVAIVAEQGDEDRIDFAVRSPARRFRMPLAMGVAAAAATALLALPVVGDDGGTQAAYALSKGSDGTITVKLFNPEGLPGLERELHGWGVSVTVVDIKPVAECHASGGGFDGPLGLIQDERGIIVGHDGRTELISYEKAELVLKINSATLPEGHTLVLGKPGKPTLTTLRVGAIRTSLVPSCLPEYPAPPGGVTVNETPQKASRSR